MPFFDTSAQKLPDGCHPRCPGCAHRHLPVRESLARKQAWLGEKLAPWAESLQPVCPAGAFFQWGYRHRVCLSASWQAGKWTMGLIKNNTVVPIPDCPVHAPQIRDAVSLFAAALPDPGRFPLAYFVQTGGQVTLVVKSKNLPDMQWLTPALMQDIACIGIQGLWLHLHPCTGKKIFAKNTWHLICGAPRSIDENGLIHGPRTFSQLIPPLYRQALSAAQAFLAPGAADIMVDLYCGIGPTLAKWQKTCPTVIGVELDGEAVACARENTPDVTILRGKCKDRIPQLTAAAAAFERRRLYVNPPRTGLEPEVTQWIVRTYQPDRMAYLSCSAGTLARDLALLEAHRYRVAALVPFDFFPRTLHVETLALIASQKSVAP